jgi:outer membrane biosynthesis protein TonB
MSMLPFYRSSNLPWHTAEEDEERFRRILKRSVSVFLVFALILPFLPLPKIDRTKVEELPPRLAKLLIERQQQPKPEPIKAPAPEQKKPLPEQPKPKEPKPKESKNEPKKVVQAAREKAERSGLLAFKEDLADLRSDSTVSNLRNTKTLTKGGATSTTKMPERSLLTSSAAGGSGGINTAKLSRDTGGQGLTGRATTRVDSPVGEGGGGGRVQRGGSNKPARSTEEVQLVFDRNKSAIYSLYNRELRKDPTLQGKVVLELKIAPSGKVLACKVISSELRSPELESKIAARVMLFEFGAKNVDVTIVTNRFDFSPSS